MLQKKEIVRQILTTEQTFKFLCIQILLTFLITRTSLNVPVSNLMQNATLRKQFAVLETLGSNDRLLNAAVTRVFFFSN